MSVLRRFVRESLLKRGVVLSHPPGEYHLHGYKLLEAKQRGLAINVAVDGGAASGHWTREFKSVYPAAQVLMIEPREDAQPSLRELAQAHTGLSIAQTLLGDHEGTAQFHLHGTQSSILPNSTGASFGTVNESPIATLDNLVAARKLPYPDLIKLDLQGFELTCLDGARNCLAHAEALVLEVSFVPFQEGMPLVADVVRYVNERGFRWYDLLALWHRPLDGALAQGDVLFLHERSRLCQDRRWAADADWS